ncbi:hypothetical protein SDC9_187213 [bioreactor metagenome]|uniref:Uncharacterized protein n=1 Tax=bioreactor metagenome TaxID=1076179 RepID=A0A645HU57_9ZZZZ
MHIKPALMLHFSKSINAIRKRNPPVRPAAAADQPASAVISTRDLGQRCHVLKVVPATMGTIEFTFASGHAHRFCL